MQRIEEILEENKEVKLINEQMEAQIESLQGEMGEFESNEEKFVQQVLNFLLFFSF